MMVCQTQGSITKVAHKEVTYQHWWWCKYKATYSNSDVYHLHVIKLVISIIAALDFILFYLLSKAIALQKCYEGIFFNLSNILATILDVAPRLQTSELYS